MQVGRCKTPTSRTSDVGPSGVVPALRKLAGGRPVMVLCGLRYSVPAGWIPLGGTSFVKVEAQYVAAEEGSFGDQEKNLVETGDPVLRMVGQVGIDAELQLSLSLLRFEPLVFFVALMPAIRRISSESLLLSTTGMLIFPSSTTRFVLSSSCFAFASSCFTFASSCFVFASSCFVFASSCFVLSSSCFSSSGCSTEEDGVI